MAQITDNIKKGFREAATGLKARRFVLRMDYPTIFFGALLIVLSVTAVVVALPFFTYKVEPSPDARPLSVAEEHGRAIYASNGCWYCHSQYLRPQDWTGVKSFETLGRVAQAGDFAYQKGMLLGSERTGPDLSQEGGAHPDDWHVAHFYNPRYTSVKSIMPEFSFWSDEERNDTISYVQSLGGKPGVARSQKQREVKSATLQTRGLPSDDPKDPFKNRRLQVQAMFDDSWANVTNPIPTSPRSLQHGKYVFQTNCIGCHGVYADGKGPAARYVQPQPFNFTQANQQAWLSDGQMYLALLYGVEGTSMPAWGDFLTVNDIWDTVNFLRTVPYGSLTAGREPTIEMFQRSEELVRANPQDPSKNPYRTQFNIVNKGSYYNPQNIGPKFNPSGPSTGVEDPSTGGQQQRPDVGNYPIQNSIYPPPYQVGTSGVVTPVSSSVGNGSTGPADNGGSMPPTSSGGNNGNGGAGSTGTGGTSGGSGTGSTSGGSK